MIPLTKLLPTAAGADLVIKCWGEMPNLRLCEPIHLRRNPGKDGCEEILFTSIFWTGESDDVNECKPSKILILFSGVEHWEWDKDSAEENGIRFDDRLKTPPSGYLAVSVYGLELLCRSITILSCERYYMTKFSEVD